MELPIEDNLPVNKLAACFRNTSATYKFYWLLALIDSNDRGETTIQKSDLFARMIAKAWFTVNYFHVSFGKQDLIQQTVRDIAAIENIDIHFRAETVYDKLKNSQNATIQNRLWHFNNNVPHWFLSPWFPGESKARIYTASQQFANGCIYSLGTDTIIFNPAWISYFQRHSKILKDFCYWNLTLFLQAKNPSVPDIPNKLIRPGTRSNLNKQKQNFWDIVIRKKGTVQCIYTSKELTVGNYALDHFIPHAFVSHDLIWNLIPACSLFNNTKRDKLPLLDKYYEGFFNLQKTALDIIKDTEPKNKFLEDYLSIFPDTDNSFTNKEFRDRIHPLITIASNNGFNYFE